MSQETKTTRKTGSTLELDGLLGLSEDDARQRFETRRPERTADRKTTRCAGRRARGSPRTRCSPYARHGWSHLPPDGRAHRHALLLGFVFVIMAITVIAGRRTERALDALRDLSSPLRVGRPWRYTTHDHAGRKWCAATSSFSPKGIACRADAILRGALNLSTDESLLTESRSQVRAAPSEEPTTLDKPGGDDLPSVFSGTLVTAGQGIAEVIAIGAHSELGKDRWCLEEGGARGDVAPEGDAAPGARVR